MSCELSGQHTSCSEAAIGTTARLKWRKKVIKNNTGVQEVMCAAPGVWVKSPVKVPGYDRIGDLGLFKISLVGAPFEVADAMCQQDGARIWVIDSWAKVAMARDILTKGQVFVGAEHNFDLWAGITNKKNMISYETIYGKPATEIPDFEKKGVGPNLNKNEPMCAVYYIKELRYYVGPCKLYRGFVCELLPEEQP